MKTPTTQAIKFRPIISQMLLALACVSALGGVAISSAHADDDRYDRYDRRGRHDNGWHGGKKNRHQRNAYRYEERRYPPTYYYQEPYYRARPVYSPPPVYYAPQPSPGVSFFFPLEIHRR